MKHKLLVDIKSYNKKPNEEAIKIIQNTIFNYPCELTLEEILKEAVAGKTFKASYLTGKESKTFVSSSLLCIDVDNKTYKKQVIPSVTFEQAKALLEEHNIKVAAAYTTFSHTDTWPKFRILIQLDQTVMLLQEMKKLYDIIKKTFDFQDGKISPGSLYFGGVKALYCDPSAVTKISDIYKIDKKNYPQTLVNTGVQPKSRKSTQSLSHVLIDIDCVEKENNSEKPVISTLRDTFYERVLQHASEEPLIFNTFEASVTYLKTLPLDKLLGLGRLFKCIVHEDQKASAGIYQYNDGTYHYHCFSCGAVMDIIDFTAVFMQLDPQHDFITICNKLNKMLNIKVVNSIWKENADKQYKQSKKVLSQLNKYKLTHPRAVKVLEYGDSVYRLLADEALISLEYVPAKDAKDLPLTRASIRYIAKRTGLSFEKTRGRLEKLQQAGFIRQLSDKETKAASNYFGKTAKINYSDRYTINTYAVGYINNVTLCEAEACMIRFRDSGATLRSKSAKQSLHIEGNNNTCVKSDVLKKPRLTQEEKVLLTWATRTVKRKKCFLKESLIKYGLSKRFKKDDIERSITMITNTLNLKRVIVSKEFIKTYNLPKSASKKALFISQV